MILPEPGNFPTGLHDLAHSAEVVPLAVPLDLTAGDVDLMVGCGCKFLNGGPGFRLASPSDAALRGSQVCLAHPAAEAIVAALIARGVIGDFRPPDVLRFGLTPPTLSHADLWDAAQALRDVARATVRRFPRELFATSCIAFSGPAVPARNARIRPWPPDSRRGRRGRSAA